MNAGSIFKPKFKRSQLFCIALILSCTTTASAERIQVRRIIDFGTLDAVSGVCTMKKNGNLNGSCTGQGTTGIVVLSRGVPRAKVDVSVHSGTSSIPGVTFVPKLANRYKRLDRSGKIRVKVIGDLIIDSTASGLADLSYVLDINYN